MGPPSRNSSLRPENPPMYRFSGNARTDQPGQFDERTPPRIVFEHVSDDSDYEHDEKTGFSTPTSENEKSLSYSYPYASNPNHKISQKPLIDYINHDWRVGSTKGTGEVDDDFCPEEWQELLFSRAFKRWLVVWLVLTVVFWTWWFSYFSPKQAKTVASSFLTDSLKGRFVEDSEYGYFGTNKRVEFAGMQHLAVLDRKLVPGSETAGVNGRRLIIVGDVHGCADELETLLKKVEFDSATDHLISTGDMVSKGPASDRVLDTMIQHQASCVRGNNEDRILHAYRDHHEFSHQKVYADQQSLTEQAAVPLRHGHHRDLSLAASLSAEQASYIASCPVILNLGAIPSMGSNVSVVHAGLVPGISLEKQDPIAVMTMRSIDLRNQVPSPRHPPDPATGPPPRPRNRFRKPDYKEWDERGRLAMLPWTDVWETFQEMIPDLLEEGIKMENAPPPAAASSTTISSSSSQQSSTQPQTSKPKNPYKHLTQSSVIYGHDSRAGIKEGKWYTGLDGGCFRGGSLAALVIEETSFVKSIAGNKVKRTLVTVQCRDYMAPEEEKRDGEQHGDKDKETDKS